MNLQDATRMTLVADVTIKMPLCEGETEEQAQERLYTALYDGLCKNAESQIDFVIERQEIEE